MSIRPVQNYRFTQKNRGFTLLEALIGFLILSVGMLGIASLQAVSLKAGKTSLYGSVAMMKVEELLESMRANPVSLSDYTGAGANNNCSNVDCSATALAQDDLFWWNLNLTAGLPAAATTSITVTDPVAPSNLATVTITVNWNERNKDSAGSVARSYTTTSAICATNPC